MKKPILITVIALLFVFSLAYANQKVKLTGYVVDVKCAAEHAKGKPEDIMKFAAEHTKECALKEECVRSGYGIFADGQWFPFDAKGNELAKALIEKTQKKDHIKVTVEGTKHGGKIFVQKLTEANQDFSVPPKTSGEAIAGNAYCFFQRQIGEIEGMLGLIDISQFTAPPPPKE